jgi:hypothetical protein
MKLDHYYGMLLPGVPFAECPNKSETAIPAIIIQIKLLLAAESRTTRLILGSNRNPAKISAAAIVPTNPARVPKRIATKITIARKRNGKNVRNELL